MESFIEAAIIATLCDIGIVPNAIVKNWPNSRNGYIAFYDTPLIYRDTLKIVKPEVLINAIKTIDRDNVESNFWAYEEYMDMDGLFDYMTGEEISDEFDNSLEKVKQEMIEELKEI